MNEDVIPWVDQLARKWGRYMQFDNDYSQTAPSMEYLLEGSVLGVFGDGCSYKGRHFLGYSPPTTDPSQEVSAFHNALGSCSEETQKRIRAHYVNLETEVDVVAVQEEIAIALLRFL